MTLLNSFINLVVDYFGFSVCIICNIISTLFYLLHSLCHFFILISCCYGFIMLDISDNGRHYCPVSNLRGVQPLKSVQHYMVKLNTHIHYDPAPHSWYVPKRNESIHSPKDNYKNIQNSTLRGAPGWHNWFSVHLLVLVQAMIPSWASC